MQYNEQTKSILSSSSFDVQTVKDFNAICADALKNFDLPIFEFARLYDDGRAVMLYSDPNVGKYVIENKIDIVAKVPQSILSKKFWYMPDPAGPYATLIRDIKEMTGACGWADYIVRYHGYFDMFCFWSPVDQSLAANSFINMKESLEKFCNGFAERAQVLIKFVEQDKFIVPATIAPNFRGLNKDEEVDKFSELHVIFEKAQRLLMEYGSNYALTSKEQECIKFMMLGKTAQDIAAAIGLSSRTIEMHLDSIKSKLGCTRKSEIISSIIQFESR